MILNKVCIDCKKEKNISHYHKRGDDSVKRLNRCKPCQCAKAKYYRSQTPNYSRHRLMKTKYGITLEKYQKMFEQQKGACAMCLRRSDRSLCVDHDHVSKRIRGLLCNSCNALIGFAQEDQAILKSAVDYLIKYKS